MPNRSRSIEQVLAILGENPSRIAALTANSTRAQLSTRPAPDAWSANDLLAHLRACADVWGNCIETIVAQDTPTIRAVNPTTWINNTDYLKQDFHSSFHAFAAQRTQLLTNLQSLAPQKWSRTATITGAGKPLR